MSPPRACVAAVLAYRQQPDSAADLVTVDVDCVEKVAAGSAATPLYFGAGGFLQWLAHCHAARTYCGCLAARVVSTMRGDTADSARAPPRSSLPHARARLPDG